MKRKKPRPSPTKLKDRIEVLQGIIAYLVIRAGGQVSMTREEIDAVGAASVEMHIGPSGFVIVTKRRGKAPAIDYAT